MSDLTKTSSEPTPAATELEIWIVVAGAEKLSQGFLVTTRDRLPKLIAYVSRADMPGLLSAKLIASEKSSPETEENLRGKTDAPLRFVNSLLIPMDFIEGRDTTFVAASFIQIGGQAVPNFIVYTESGFSSLCKKVIDRALSEQRGTEAQS